MRRTRQRSMPMGQNARGSSSMEANNSRPYRGEGREGRKVDRGKREEQEEDEKEEKEDAKLHKVVIVAAVL